MTEHNFDFDDAMSVAEFFENNGVALKDQRFTLKTCHPYLKDAEGNVIYDEDGNPKKDLEHPFESVGFRNGETTENGTPAYTFFVLSRALTEQGNRLDKAFLKEHKEDLKLLEPVDTLKYGIVFLQGGGEDWNDL